MDITQICSAIIKLMVSLLIAYLIPVIKQKYAQEQINEAMESAKEVNRWITVFVQAAEQLFPEVGAGGNKKAYVLSLMTQTLAKLNIEIDAEVLDAQIESAVLELHQALMPIE